MIYPSLSQFLVWSEKYCTIPILLDFPIEKRRDFFDYYLLLNSKSKNSFLLDSVHTLSSASHERYSYFSLTPPEKTFESKSTDHFSKNWKKLKQWMSLKNAPILSRNLPPFYGGAVGILSYDCGRIFEPGWKTKPPRDPLKFSLMQIGIYDHIACLDHKTGRFFLSLCLHINKETDKNLKEIYEKGCEKIIQLADELKINSFQYPQIKERSKKENTTAILPNKKQFLESVEKIKNYISAGDIYQANLSQRISIPFHGHILNFYRRLRKINPSPYSCLFRLNHFDLISSSPELLLKKRGEILETRPIAGTRPRGIDKISDQKLEGELLLNEKERAEHIMLVDLERNDLGRICRSGSVKISEKMVIEKYSHVMHIVSHIKGRIKKSENIFSAIESVFPGGTITGCPKVRCMEILDDLEPVARGPFFGSAGWIGYQGDGELNLLIRTALIKKNNIHIQAGSGIVADSSPESEYTESLHKAQALLKAIGE